MPNTGELVNGKVVKIVDKGAFIKLSEKETGFLHISEVSEKYVKNVSDHLEVGQEVQVRVTNVDRRRNKISLSIKRVNEENEEMHKKMQFENKMKRFLRESGEKIKQIQKSTESKQGIKKRVPKKK